MELGNRVIINQKGHFYNNCIGVIVGKRGFRAPGDPMYLLMMEDHRKILIVPESMLALCENDDENKGPSRLLFRSRDN
ncbi:MAG: hypothetical protein GXZ09_08840 [Syntrophomonadaceae bacterium]|jgi:hypothetical protein|nr:hypothetical protein [Syntrophomonadaceae bacterium]